MKIRYKKDGAIGYASGFNVAACSEVVVNADWGGDSAYIRDLDVEVNGTWVDMHKAFTDKLIVPDNYNVSFAPPINEECRLRGYNP